MPSVLDLETKPVNIADATDNGLDDRGAGETDLRASIERGIADADAGRLIAVEDLLEEFGIEDPSGKAAISTTRGKLAPHREIMGLKQSAKIQLIGDTRRCLRGQPAMYD